MARIRTRRIHVHRVGIRGETGVFLFKDKGSALRWAKSVRDNAGRHAVYEGSFPFHKRAGHRFIWDDDMLNRRGLRRTKAVSELEAELKGLPSRKRRKTRTRRRR